MSIAYSRHLLSHADNHHHTASTYTHTATIGLPIVGTGSCMFADDSQKEVDLGVACKPVYFVLYVYDSRGCFLGGMECADRIHC